MLVLQLATAFEMGKIYQIHVIGLHGERKTIDVANSEEEFKNTTVSTLKEKIIQKFPEYKGNIIYRKHDMNEYKYM